MKITYHVTYEEIKILCKSVIDIEKAENYCRERNIPSRVILGTKNIYVKGKKEIGKFF